MRQTETIFSCGKGQSRWRRGGGSDGFTLIELLISMALGAMVMVTVWSSFDAQHRSYIVQDDTAFMQQNLRAAAEMLDHEIRMAGYDPNFEGIAGTSKGITAMGASTITLSFWNDDNNEFDTVTYILADAFTADGSNDGDLDLMRSLNGGAATPVAENIDALNFVMLDRNGVVTNTLADARTVEVTLVARAEGADQRFVNNTIYTNLQGAVVLPAQGDNFRRRQHRSSVLCRNLWS